MKCPHCGAELNEHSAVCTTCGKPIGADAPTIEITTSERPRTERKLRHAEKTDHRFETISFDDPGEPPEELKDALSEDAQRAPQSFAGAPSAGMNPVNMTPPAVDQAPVYAAPAPQRPYAPGAQNNSDSGKAKKHTALWLSLIALLLVIAVVTGVIFFLRGKSDKELQQAKDSYVAPAEAVAQGLITESDITFKYDETPRLASCSYTVNDHQYDQKYTYDDEAQKVNIETACNKQSIYTAEFSYGSVKSLLDSKIRVAFNGYYFGGSPSGTDAEGDSNKSSSQAGGNTAASEANGASSGVANGPAPMNGLRDSNTTATQSSSSNADWRAKYTDYFHNHDLSQYSSACLIYLDADDIPELVFSSSTTYRGKLICWVGSDGTVKEHITDAAESFKYSDSGRLYLLENTLNGAQSKSYYYFDGDSISDYTRDDAQVFTFIALPEGCSTADSSAFEAYLNQN